MRHRMLACFTLTAAMAVMGATTLTAADRYDAYRDRGDFRQDYRQDNRDMGYGYARVNGLRAQIARDEARLREDIRCGRNWAAERDAQELARDRWALDAQFRNLRRDQGDRYYDRRDQTGSYYDRRNQADRYDERRDPRSSYGSGWR
jgi:hypothetical protein